MAIKEKVRNHSPFQVHATHIVWSAIIRVLEDGEIMQFQRDRNQIEEHSVLAETGFWSRVTVAHSVIPYQEGMADEAERRF